MGTEAFTADDLAYFRYQSEQARRAQPVIERDYDRLAGPEGAWVALLDGALVAKASTADDLAGLLEKKGVNREQVLIRYLPGHDSVLVL